MSANTACGLLIKDSLDELVGALCRKESINPPACPNAAQPVFAGASHPGFAHGPPPDAL